MKDKMEEYIEENIVKDKNYHLTNAGERWGNLSRHVALVEANVYSVQNGRKTRSSTHNKLYAQLLQIREDGRRRLEGIRWVLEQGCNTLDVIKYLFVIMSKRQTRITEARVREDEDFRAMTAQERDETDEEEDEMGEHSLANEQTTHWIGGNISSDYDEEGELQLIQTKYGYLRKEGMQRAIFQMWITAARKLRIEKQLNYDRNNCQEEKRKAEAMELEEDEKKNNTAGMWETMRKMGGTNRGPKKRKMNVPLTEVPDADEWAAHLAQEGKDGGCKATEITRTDGDLHKGEVVKLELKQISVGNKRKAEFERNKLFTHENILSQFKSGKNGRAVPAGLARKETWQMFMEDSDIGRQIIQTDWREIHAEGYYPGTFRESEGCLIPKGNAKS